MNPVHLSRSPTAVVRDEAGRFHGYLFGASCPAKEKGSSTFELFWPTCETWEFWRARADKGNMAEQAKLALSEMKNMLLDTKQAAANESKIAVYGQKLVEMRQTLDKMKAKIIPSKKAEAAGLTQAEKAAQIDLATSFSALSARYYKLAEGFYGNAYPLKKDGTPLLSKPTAAKQYGPELPPKQYGPELPPAVGGSDGDAFTYFDDADSFIYDPADYLVSMGCTCSRGERLSFAYADRGYGFGWGGDEVYADDDEFGWVPVVTAAGVVLVVKTIGIALLLAGAAYALANLPAMISALGQALVEWKRIEGNVEITNAWAKVAAKEQEAGRPAPPMPTPEQPWTGPQPLKTNVELEGGTGVGLGLGVALLVGGGLLLLSKR